MAAAERRRGRRDNGLDASSWRALEDLDPRLSAEVLDALGTRGIAAYVQPAMDVDPVTRSATVPSPPSDRLYVDRQQVEAAREHLRRLREEQRRRTTDLDVTFAGIVADFDRPNDQLTTTWPAAEEISAEASWTDPPLTEPPPSKEPQPAEPAEPSPVDARHVVEPSLLDALDALDQAPEDPEELPERFVPPPPPPLPRLSRQTVLGGLAIVVGLVLLLGRPSLLPLDRSETMLLGFAVILGGAVALILRLRPGTDPDEPGPGSHPGDGAQV